MFVISLQNTKKITNVLLLPISCYLATKNNKISYLKFQRCNERKKLKHLFYIITL